MATQSKPISDQPEIVRTDESQEVTSSVDSAVGAAFIASGFGSFVLGLAVLGAETNASIKSFLTWIGPVGPLSGKVGLAVIGFVLSWIILHFVLRDRPLKLTTSFAISLV